MDYVVFGIGMGASLVLLGLAGRAIGPMLRYRQSRTKGEVLSAVELLAQVAWARFCNALGAAIAMGGLLLLIVTGINMALRVDDGAAALIVGLTLLLIVVLMAIWTWAFIGRFGLHGIVSRQTETSDARTKQSYDVDEWLDSDAELDMSFLTTPSPQPDTASAATTNQPQSARPQTDRKTETSTRSAAVPKRSFALRLNRKPSASTGSAPVSAPAEQSPVSTRSEPVPDAPATEPGTPEASFASSDHTSVAEPMVATSRSEVVNPSDAAALERILGEPDEPTNVDLDSFFLADQEIVPEREELPDPGSESRLESERAEDDEEGDISESSRVVSEPNG